MTASRLGAGPTRGPCESAYRSNGVGYLTVPAKGDRRERAHDCDGVRHSSCSRAPSVRNSDVLALVLCKERCSEIRSIAVRSQGSPLRKSGISAMMRGVTQT